MLLSISTESQPLVLSQMAFIRNPWMYELVFLLKIWTFGSLSQRLVSFLLRRHTFGPFLEFELIFEALVHFLDVVLILFLEHVGNFFVV